MKNINTSHIREMTDEQLKKYIISCDADYEAALERAAGEIASRPSLRLCGLAGPSCSGKTTTSFKLTVYLIKRGLWVRTLSIDDFFIDRGKGPLGEDGKPDYESLDFINLDLLHSVLEKVLRGESVWLPKYDFITGRRDDRHEKYVPEKNEIIVLEGLHALNDIMYGSLPEESYYRMFINVESGVSVDGEPLFTGREVRLMRRLIRDFKYRGASAAVTFDMWDNVGKGEEKYIFPFMDRADLRSDTLFAYEPCVMKEQAVSVLSGLDGGSEYAAAARGIISKLEKVPDIDESLVPANAMMREFLGGTYFKYD